MKGVFVDLKDTIKGFSEIVSGKYDHLPEPAFYMVGNISDVISKAERLAAEVAASKGTTTESKDKDKGAPTGPPRRVIVDPKTAADKLKKVAMDARAKELKRAAEIKAAALKGIGPGWSFPKEDQINEKWDKWSQNFDKQSQDVLGLFKSHFENTKRDLEEEAAKQQTL